MELPIGLVCVECGTVFGALTKPTLSRLGEERVEAICGPCVGRLSREKGITPDRPQSWQKLLSKL